MSLFVRYWSRKVKIVFLAGCLALSPVVGSGPSHADSDTLLVVRKGTANTLNLDLAALDALPQRSFETTTQWTEGKIVFSGPSLEDLLHLVNVSAEDGPVIHMIAENLYEVTLENQLIKADVPIVATRMNGETFGLRDKGPLWVVFPYDQSAEYQSESVYSASIWQLVEIDIKG